MRLPKRDTPQESHGPSNYLKLKDGESKIGVFRGEPYEFRIKWENNKSVVVEETDPNNFNRFKLNFITQENGVFVAKVWEFGLTVYDQLSEINTEYPLERTKVKVSRKGTGTDTTYNILPMLKEPIPPTTLAQIESVQLNMLDKAHSKPKTEETPWPSSDEIPF